MNTHKKSNSDYEENNNKIIFNEIEKRGTPSNDNDELIRIDLPSKNKKRKREMLSSSEVPTTQNMTVSL